MVFYRTPALIIMNDYNEAGILTPKQVSEILQLNILTIYSYIKSKKLPAIRLGRSYRITKEDLLEFLKTHSTIAELPTI